MLSKKIRRHIHLLLMTALDTSPSNNLFILFVPPSCKKGNNLDVHYNCYVNKEYFKQNEAAIKSRIVMPIEENQEHVAAPTSADNVSQSSMENFKNVSLFFEK